MSDLGIATTVSVAIHSIYQRVFARKGRELSFEDILHYQKIIVALTETGRIMKERIRRGWSEKA